MVSGTFNVGPLLLPCIGRRLCENGRTLLPGQLWLETSMKPVANHVQPVTSSWRLCSCTETPWRDAGFNRGLVQGTTYFAEHISSFLFIGNNQITDIYPFSRNNTLVTLRSRENALWMLDVGAQSLDPVWPIITSPKRLSLASLTLRRRIKSHLLFAGIIRSSPFSPR